MTTRALQAPAHLRARAGIPLLALLLLLSGCDGGGEVARSFASEEVPTCAPVGPGCDPLAIVASDTMVLARLAEAERIDARELGRLTALEWRERKERDGALHVRLAAVNPLEEGRTAYVVDVVHADAAHDTVLSIASNGGTVVWLNGELLGRSRTASRGLRAHQDLYAVRLAAGRNLVVYRVVTTSEEAQLHREWRSVASLPELLDATRSHGAWTALLRTPIVPDTSAALELWPPQVRLGDRPRLRFRWLTLLGEPLAEGATFAGAYPERLPLPEGFAGQAVLELEVRDAGAGGVLHYEQLPVFADSTAQRLARTLVAAATRDTAMPPVQAARIAAVRVYFGLDSTVPGGSLPAWSRAQALADLYRLVHQPEGFHRHPGPQVWGYRAADGTVQPYWLTVPPGAVGIGAPPGRAPGLVYSLTHMVDTSYWRGRGSSEGWIMHMSTLSAAIGNFSVLPHLRGRHDFAELGREELRAITHQVDSVFGIDTARVAILAWSAHARETVQLARDPSLPLARVGFAVPALHQDAAELARDLDALAAVRPGLHFTFWRAGEDDRIPRERTEGWVKAVRRAGFPVEYHDVEYSTHLGGFFRDVEAELHRQIATRPDGS